MIKKILILLALLAAILLGVTAMQPDTYSVTRTATIAAPPDQVFALVNDFHEWTKWSPWEKIDPNMTRTYEGAPAGAGAVYSWKGNSDVGSGKMTLVESRPGEHIAIDLDFKEPFESSSVNEFHFTPEGGGTKVEWKMAGDSNMMSKLFSLLMGGMDKMIGPDFEKGLVQMKAVAEGK